MARGQEDPARREQGFEQWHARQKDDLKSVAHDRACYHSFQEAFNCPKASVKKSWHRFCLFPHEYTSCVEKKGREECSQMTHKYWIGVALLALAIPQISFAGQSVSSIAVAAALFAEERAARQGYEDVTVNVRPLDSRISLAACTAPLSASSSGERVLGPVSVAVKCTTPALWTVHVRATVTTTVELPVLAYAVNRGDIIGQNDIEWREQEVSRDLVGYVTDELKIIGKEARKHLRSGNPLRSSDLVSPQIIERGQTVDLVARSSGLLVNMQGKALANGAEGDRLLVQNTSSGKKVEGLIMASGTVLIQ